MIKKILFILVIIWSYSYAFDIAEIEVGDTLYIADILEMEDEVEVLKIDKKKHSLYCRRPNAKREWIPQTELLTYGEVWKIRIYSIGTILLSEENSEKLGDYIKDSIDYGDLEDNSSSDE